MTACPEPLSVAVNAVGLAPGGGQTFLINQALELERFADLRLFYYVSPRIYDALSAVVPSDRVCNPWSRPPSYRKRILWEQVVLPKLLARGGFDVLYAPASFAVFRSPVPQLVVDHNPWHFARFSELESIPVWVRAQLQRRLARWSANRADAVIYLTHAYENRMRDVGFPPATEVVPSGVSVDWGTDAELAQSPLECVACLTRGYALAVHNWYPHKRLGWLARAWSDGHLSDDMHLVIVGEAYGWSARHHRNTVLGAAPMGVHVLQGLSRPQVGELFGKAKVFLSASALEAFPLTPLEAMSLGVPCVLSAIPVHREVAQDAAAYFGLEDAGELAASVRYAVEHSLQLLEAGHRRVAAYRWSDNADIMRRQFWRGSGRR